LTRELKKLDEKEKNSKEATNVFITENEETLDDLVKRAPLKFEFLPTRTVMQKLIVKGTQIKNLQDFQI
jgi:hypothetical protein